MQEEAERAKQAVKTSKIAFDESKLTPPQRKALAIAKAQGVRMARKFEDLNIDLGLTKEEADQFGRTIQEMREESRKQESKKIFG